MALMKTPLLFCLFLVAAAANAVPHVFSPGQNASSQQVNENFSALEARILALEGGTVPPPSGTPTPAPAPAPGPGECIHPSLEGGLLTGGSGTCRPEAVSGTDPTYMLTTADDILLSYIYSGSIELQDQYFAVVDKDSVLGAEVFINFIVESDGSLTEPLGLNSGQGFSRLYKSADCTGDGYLPGVDPSFFDTTLPLVNLYSGEVAGTLVREALKGLDDTEENVVFESQFEEGGANTGECRVSSQVVSLAGIPIAYDITPVANVILTPIKIVEYVAP